MIWRLIIILFSLGLFVGCFNGKDVSEIEDKAVVDTSGQYVPGSVLVNFERENYSAVEQQVLQGGLSYNRNDPAFSRTVLLNLPAAEVLEQLRAESLMSSCVDNRSNEAFKLDWDVTCRTQPDVQDSVIEDLMQEQNIVEYDILETFYPSFLEVTVPKGQEDYWVEQISKWPLVTEVGRNAYMEPY